MRRLADFEGRWTVTRTIRDFTGGPDCTFTGAVTFTPRGKFLDVREQGTFRAGPAAPMEATRAYIWQGDGAGGIAVRFHDTRPFHRIGPGDRPEDTHHCTPDTYRVAYDFTRWPRWSATWRVTGPRKDYESVSRYAPCGDPGAGAETMSDTITQGSERAP